MGDSSPPSIDLCPDGPPTAFLVTLYAVCVMVAGSNGVVVLSLRALPRKQAHDYLIGSMAVADLLMACGLVFGMSVSGHDVGRFPWPICTVLAFLTVLFGIASVSASVLIAFARWRTLKLMSAGRETPLDSGKIVMTSWLLAFAISVWTLLFDNYD
eukprot:777713_1